MIALLAHAQVARASELSDDLSARRERVMQRLGPDAMLVLWSAPVRPYSLDITYEYRQDSNLYYLTGLAQADTILVLMPGNRTHREVLFVRQNDQTQEHWQGRTLSFAEVSARSGVKTVLLRSQFDAFVAGVMGRHDVEPLASHEADTFFNALGEKRARIALIMGEGAGNAGDQSPTKGTTGAMPDPAIEPTAEPLVFAKRIRGQFIGFQTFDATPTLTELRTIKTPYERKMLATSVLISSDAQKAGMLAARPGAYEYEVKAAVEAVQRARGALSPAYPSIVGSGPNATILHYPEDRRRMSAGELLLVDAGANYEYMAADITRTYPVDGTFTSAQRDIYDAVFKARLAAMSAASAGGSLEAIHSKAVDAAKAALLQLGLIKDAGSDQYKMWYTHLTGHYVGIDVHDGGDRTRPLAPGMAFSIEPGLYIRQSVLDALPRTPENLALIGAIQPAVTKYAGIGVRIEDTLLYDDGGLRLLSADLPVTIDGIQAFMRTRK